MAHELLSADHEGFPNSEAKMTTTSTKALSTEDLFSTEGKARKVSRSVSLRRHGKTSFESFSSTNSKDINKESETSSIEDLHRLYHYHLPSQPHPSNDIAMLSKAVSALDMDNDGSHVAVPADKNPVSRLLEDSDATSKACDALGRAMVRAVDTRTIQAILDVFLATTRGEKHPLSATTQQHRPHHRHRHHPPAPTMTALSSSSSPRLQPLKELDELDDAVTTAQKPLPTPSISLPSPTPPPPPGIQPNNDAAQRSQEKIAHLPPLPAAGTSSLDLSRPSLETSSSIRRKNAIKELMQTEAKYLEDLRILVMDTKCISKMERDIIVRNGYDILCFQEDFSEALQMAHGYDFDRHELSDMPDVKRIAQCFVQWGPRFDIYREYCVGQDKAMATYRYLLETNDAFSNVMERTHSFLRVSLGFGLGSKLTFDDYLITPFQRVFRYRLMLQAITKTAKEEESHELAKAQDVMHEIASRLNMAKTRMEAEKKTDLFLARLQSDWTIPRRWHSALGSCVLIGTLEVHYVQEGGKPKRYGCALFGTYMIIVKAKKSKNCYTPRHWFPLRMFDLDEVEDKSMVHAWRLFNEEHAIEFGAMCEQEKQIWVTALRKAIHESKMQYVSQDKDVQNKSDLIEQLFVSSFDKPKPNGTTSMAAERMSPASNHSSLSLSTETAQHPPMTSSSTPTPRLLTRKLSTMTMDGSSLRRRVSNKRATSAATGNRMSKLFFMHGNQSMQRLHLFSNQNQSSTSVNSSEMDDAASTIRSTGSSPLHEDGTTPPMYRAAATASSQQPQARALSLDIPCSSSSTLAAPMLAASHAHTGVHDGGNAPMKRSQSSIIDFRDFIQANVTGKWSQRKYAQYQTKRHAIDSKFEDVSTTPILTARSQARQDGSFEQWRRRSTLVDESFVNYQHSGQSSIACTSQQQR
ncbi:hypothetical protein BC940DRAFT_323189 [Gongronella butleri]|nr:hypothetical protein BC940DRAFT_323189 [Gongronella butleri]